MAAMRLLSVNVSQIKTFPYRGKEVTTGIFKTPVDTPVMVRTLNLDGDKQADLTVHGGKYKAVYFYPHEHYATWQAELQREPFSYGQFGENFTVTGLLETEVYVGDIYRVGQALVQITQPRSPCFKLNHKMQAGGDFGKRFLQAGRTGFYGLVLEEGEVKAGDAISLEQQHNEKVSVYAINHLVYLDPSDLDLAERALRIESLAPGWQGSMQEIVGSQYKPETNR